MAEEFKRAGWYPDPTGVRGERWWNGASWSETQREAIAPVVPAPAIYSASNPPPERPDPYAPISQPAAARVIDLRVNRNASIGFITGVVSLFFNALFLLAPVAVVLSILGIRAGLRLKAQGVTNTGVPIAWAGLVCGAIAVLTSLVGVIALIASITFDVSP